MATVVALPCSRSDSVVLRPGQQSPPVKSQLTMVTRPGDSSCDLRALAVRHDRDYTAVVVQQNPPAMTKHRDFRTGGDAMTDQQTNPLSQRAAALHRTMTLTAQPDQPGQREPGRIPNGSPATRQPVMGVDTRFAAKDAATVAVPDEPTGPVCCVTLFSSPLRNRADRYTPVRHGGAVNQWCPANARGRTLHGQHDGSGSAVHIYR